MSKNPELRVWWIPQVPGKRFCVYHVTVEEAILLLKTLARYDMFQYENHIKPDYSNAGGLEEWNKEDKEWYEWYNDDGMDIDEYMDYLEEAEIEETEFIE